MRSFLFTSITTSGINRNNTRSGGRSVCFFPPQPEFSLGFIVVYAEENFVTALVPSDTACLANSPGSIKRTAVWISRDDNVAFLLYVANFPASVAIRSKISLIKEFIMDIPFLEIPVSGWTCFKTL